MVDRWQQPDPEAWSANGGMGSCFHQALSRWAQFHQHGAKGWRIGIGVIPEGIDSHTGEQSRNVHAWLERGETVVSAISGDWWRREVFYKEVGIDPATVKLVNPRKIVRKGIIDKHSVGHLLDLWGGRWKLNDHRGVEAD